MSNLIRRIIEMVAKVLGFIHTHPSDDPAQAIAVTALENRSARLEAMVAQEKSGHIAEGAAIVTKENLIGNIRDGFTLLKRLATTAAREEPTMPIRLTIPKPKASHLDLLSGGRTVVSEARAHQETLAKYGLPPKFLDELSDTLDQFEAAMSAKNSGASSHVGANTEIQELVREIRDLVRLLDAFNRPRFRNNPELRGAWLAAKAVTRHTPKPADDSVIPITPTPPDEPATPGGDAAHPAA
jgi:hypothetical protein